MHLNKRIVGVMLALSLLSLQWSMPRSVSSARSGASVPPGFADEGIIGGLVNPTSFAFPPDGRIFVVEQAGDFKVFQSDGALLASTHVNVNYPTTSFTERGLVGLEVDPSFAQNQFVYVYYTRIPNGQAATSTDPTVNRLSRFKLVGNALDLASEQPLLDNVPAPTINHHGGDIHIGFDGKLWLSTGDGGTRENAPLLSSLNGKILRLNLFGGGATDNPYYTGTGEPRDYIWAKGFRNPWRFTFHPQTHAPYIGDVGQFTWEELDIGYAGADYGWPAYEGSAVYDGPVSYSFVSPLLTYNHAIGCTGIIGGDFMYDSNWPPDYQFNYFFTDLGCWRVWRVVFDANNPNAILSSSEWATDLSVPVTLKRGRDGNLYYVNYNTGELRRFRWLLTNSLYLPLVSQ